MRLVDYQEIISEKIKRQKSIPELKNHVFGHCIHVGKISPGCQGCFVGLSFGIQIGSRCMFKCPYCYYDPERKEQSEQEINNQLVDFFARSKNPNWQPTIFALQSSGETLLYLDSLEKFIEIIKKIEKERNCNFYIYLYTNGVLANDDNLKRLKDWGVKEIRFHMAASGFSEQVYQNIGKAVAQGFRATVELPSLPHYREKLFEMLPIINNLGVKHLNLVECQVTPFNINALDNLYPSGRMYQDFFIHFYDEGLVYDIIEEIINKKYNFSVLDCNSAVERCRQGPSRHVCFDMKSIEGMCDKWDIA